MAEMKSGVRHLRSSSVASTHSKQYCDMERNHLTDSATSGMPRSVNQADGNLLRQTKRQKFEAKQALRRHQEGLEQNRLAWIERNSRFCTQVSLMDVRRIKEQAGSEGGGSRLDALLRPYEDLKDGALRAVDGESDERLFIAEGTETVRLLIQQSSSTKPGCNAVKVRSILVKPASLFDDPVNLLADVERTYCSGDNGSGDSPDDSLNAPPFHILLGDEAILSEIAGFPISRGAIACGVVPQKDEAWLGEFLTQKKIEKSPIRLLAMDGISDTANMGSMIRCSAAFGIDAIILSRDCCDAWYRRSVRVSMGHIFKVPIVRVGNLSKTVTKLSRLGLETYAAVVDSGANVLLEAVDRGSMPTRWCCVVGNEANGMSTSVIQSCIHHIRIGMVDGVDSLSVPIATAILLHGLKEREPQGSDTAELFLKGA